MCKDDRETMMDVHRKFQAALSDTVDEWKKRDEVIGIFTYGSFVKGTATANSDLDLVIIWEGEEAPARLMAEHMGVNIDMDFITPAKIEEIFDDKEDHAFTVAGVISRLKGGRVEFDREGMLKTWLEKASTYSWPQSNMERIKDHAETKFKQADAHLSSDDVVSAVHETRRGIFDLARLVLMKNNLFNIIKPSEVLSDVRMLDPMTYQLILRTFRLKGLDEGEMLAILEDVQKWLEKAVDRFEKSVDIAPDSPVGAHLSQAQRHYYGSQTLTINGEFELAILEMRRSLAMIGTALLALQGNPVETGGSLMAKIRECEPVFYEEVMLKYGAFDLLPAGVQRGIGEARFIAQRL
ncbi:MAG: nucleotidyltransferase domain-containing protein [Candidatus Thorarchaeota archaeon]|nr:nucleotidyltransferase domain-containing protein [Candidatus Thorarchaeota archaeon]